MFLDFPGSRLGVVFSCLVLTCLYFFDLHCVLDLRWRGNNTPYLLFARVRTGVVDLWLVKHSPHFFREKGENVYNFFKKNNEKY